LFPHPARPDNFRKPARRDPLRFGNDIIRFVSRQDLGDVVEVFSRVGRFSRSQGKIGQGKVSQDEIAVEVKRLFQGNLGPFDLFLFFENGGEQVVQTGIAFVCRDGLFAAAEGFFELPLICQDPREKNAGFLVSAAIRYELAKFFFRIRIETVLVQGGCFLVGSSFCFLRLLQFGLPCGP
jgi:hypothetical protein